MEAFPARGTNQSIYKKSKLFMIVIGLWKLPVFENKRLQKLYKFYSAFIQAIYIIYNVSMVIKVAQIAFNNSDSQNRFRLFSFAVMVTDINFKIIVLNRNKVPFIFKDIITSEDELTQLSDQRMQQLYAQQCIYYHLTTTFQILATSLSVLLYIVFNVIKMATNQLAPEENFMYELWLPFEVDLNGPVMIGCKLILSQMGIFFNCTSHVVIQSLVVYVTFHLVMLQIMLRGVFDGECGAGAIRILIQKHQYLIEFVEKINESIKSIILVEYVLDSVNLAAAVLQILTAKSIIEIIFSLVYLVLLLSQLLILAWSANELNLQSVNVSNAIYESNWMDQNESIKKTLLIMLMRAQKPLSLTIGPFRPMNMEAGLMTMKGAYTYGGVMRQKYT